MASELTRRLALRRQEVESAAQVWERDRAGFAADASGEGKVGDVLTGELFASSRQVVEEWGQGQDDTRPRNLPKRRLRGRWREDDDNSECRSDRKTHRASWASRALASPSHTKKPPGTVRITGIGRPCSTPKRYGLSDKVEKAIEKTPKGGRTPGKTPCRTPGRTPGRGTPKARFVSPGESSLEDVYERKDWVQELGGRRSLGQESDDSFGPTPRFDARGKRCTPRRSEAVIFDMTLSPKELSPVTLQEAPRRQKSVTRAEQAAPLELASQPHMREARGAPRASSRPPAGRTAPTALVSAPAGKALSLESAPATGKTFAEAISLESAPVSRDTADTLGAAPAEAAPSRAAVAGLAQRFQRPAREAPAEPSGRPTRASVSGLLKRFQPPEREAAPAQPAGIQPVPVGAPAGKPRGADRQGDRSPDTRSPQTESFDFSAYKDQPSPAPVDLSKEAATVCIGGGAAPPPRRGRSARTSLRRFGKRTPKASPAPDEPAAQPEPVEPARAPAARARAAGGEDFVAVATRLLAEAVPGAQPSPSTTPSKGHFGKVFAYPGEPGSEFQDSKLAAIREEAPIAQDKENDSMNRAGSGRKRALADVADSLAGTPEAKRKELASLYGSSGLHNMSEISRASAQGVSPPQPRKRSLFGVFTQPFCNA